MKNIKYQNGNTVIIAVVAVIVIALGVAILISSGSSIEKSNMMNDSAMIEKDKMGDDGAMMPEHENTMMMKEDDGNAAMMDKEDSKDSMMEENKLDEESNVMMDDDNDKIVGKDDTIMEVGDGGMEDDDEAMMEKADMVVSSGEYLSYSVVNYEKAKDSKRVLFFHASWCPTCIAANNNFNLNLEKLPQGVTLLKINYDKEGDLKKKYGVTYQHTFVQVDKDGKEIAKWNGGEIDELIKKVK